MCCHFFLNVCLLLAVAGGVDACRHRLNLYNRGNAFARGVEEQIESGEHKPQRCTRIRLPQTP